MKHQGLAEPLKSKPDELSTLKSELAKKEKFIKELKKENEVLTCNFMYVCVHTLLYSVHMYIRM